MRNSPENPARPHLLEAKKAIESVQPGATKDREVHALGKRADIHLAEATTAVTFRLACALEHFEEAGVEQAKAIGHALGRLESISEEFAEGSKRTSEALIFWTKIMVAAIVIQAIAAVASVVTAHNLGSANESVSSSSEGAQGGE